MKGLAKAIAVFLTGSLVAITLAVCIKLSLVWLMGERMQRLPDLQLERLARLFQRKPVTDAKVLIIGDSTATFSLDAGLLKEAESFAMVNSTSIESYYILKRILDSGARPRCIMASFSMQWEPNREYFWSMYLANGFYEEEELAEIARVRASHGEGELPLVYALKKFAARSGVNDLISMKTLQEGVLLGRLKEVHASSSRMTLWQHKGSKSLRDTTSFEGSLDLIFSKMPYITLTEREYLNRVFALARERKIPFFLVKVPFAQSVPLEKKVKYWQKYDDLLLGLDGPFRLIGPPAMPEGFYLSAGHLNMRGGAAMQPYLQSGLESCYR